MQWVYSDEKKNEKKSGSVWSFTHYIYPFQHINNSKRVMPISCYCCCFCLSSSSSSRQSLQSICFCSSSRRCPLLYALHYRRTMGSNTHVISPYIRTVITSLLALYFSNQINIWTSTFSHLIFASESQIVLRELLRVESHRGLWRFGSVAVFCFFMIRA